MNWFYFIFRIEKTLSIWHWSGVGCKGWSEGGKINFSNFFCWNYFHFRFWFFYPQNHLYNYCKCKCHMSSFDSFQLHVYYTHLLFWTGLRKMLDRYFFLRLKYLIEKETWWGVYANFAFNFKGSWMIYT